MGGRNPSTPTRDHAVFNPETARNVSVDVVGHNTRNLPEHSASRFRAESGYRLAYLFPVLFHSTG